MDVFLTNVWSGIIILAIIGFIVYFIILPLFEKSNPNKQSETSARDSIVNDREDNERKEITVKRVFAYKYESLIYEIFAPYAVVPKTSGLFRRQRWTVDVDLEDEFIKNEISRIQHISYSDASKLFEELMDNQLLMHVNYKHKSCVGVTLTDHWDIISKNDTNLSAWMDSHSDIESKESIDKRREPFNLCYYYPFHEFVNEHGNYEVTAATITSKDTFWINFPNKMKVIFSLQELGIRVESRKNREDEINGKLWAISNLFVKDDDNHLSLIIR